MTTPFSHNNHQYDSLAWPGLTICKEEGHIAVKLPCAAEALSSAVYGGGCNIIETIVNKYVDWRYECDDPHQDLKDAVKKAGYALEQTAGLLTAVKLEYTAVLEERHEEFAIVCCTTAGISNAARAGSKRTTFSAYTPGTINVILLIDGRLSQAAMVNVLLTAVEAKAAALADLGIKDAENGLTATGTTTDSMVLGVSQSNSYQVLHRYAGTATDLGAAIGRVVYGTVIESYEEPSRRNLQA